MQFIAFLTVSAAFTSLATAMPLTRRQGVTCVPKYSGILRNAYRNNLSDGANVVVAPHSAGWPLISVSGGEEAGSQFTFEKCSYVEGWGSPPEEYGLIHFASNDGNCVTASGDKSSDGGNAFYLDTCTSDTDAYVFARQYVYANYFKQQGTAYVTLELTGGPDGQYRLPAIGDSVQKDNNYIVTAQKSGTKVLALADVQILS